jgi:carboxylesterase
VVPSPERPDKPVGCLILHGFTSSLDAVRPLVPVAERLGMPCRAPVLRGHGTRPEDLIGVRYRDWYDDARTALLELREETSSVVVCGLSMGGLVALNLAVDHPNDVSGLVTVAPALQIASPLVHVGKLITRLFSMWTPPPGRGYAEPGLAVHSTNYKSFATDAALSLHQYGAVITDLLPRVRAPLLVIHARKDTVIKPRSAELIYARAGSRQKELVWFDRSNHEMLRDCEALDVICTIERWLAAQLERTSGSKRREVDEVARHHQA